jgi:FKBP-type peptidyl-prolyl cis-trans isomerase
MKEISGLTLLEETEGSGDAASKGDSVVFHFRAFLNKGEEVAMNEVADREQWPPEMFSEVEGRTFINHSIVLGKRRAIAAIEHSLNGMKVGGYRKVKASPHLAYREQGVPGKIPPNAVLVLDIWLRQLRK